MEYAIFTTGGKQYRVSPGVVVDDARLAGGLVGVDQPYLPASVEVCLQPLAPGLPVDDVESLADVDEVLLGGGVGLRRSLCRQAMWSQQCRLESR